MLLIFSAKLNLEQSILFHYFCSLYSNILKPLLQIIESAMHVSSTMAFMEMQT